jgi:AcrR family transcriptional regulator
MADPRRARTRRRLLDAGRRVIAEHGVSGLRIAAVTEEAGVAIGSFQNHFESKDGLVAAIVREAIEALAAEIVDTGGADGDPAEVASAALRRFVRLAYEDPQFCRVLVNLHHGEELFVDAIRPYAQAALAGAVDAGAFEIEDLDIAVTSIVAGALGVIRRILDGHLGPGADSVLARSTLLSFRVDPAEAQRIAELPLPPSRMFTAPQRGVAN